MQDWTGLLTAGLAASQQRKGDPTSSGFRLAPVLGTCIRTPHPPKSQAMCLRRINKNGPTTIGRFLLT